MRLLIPILLTFLCMLSGAFTVLALQHAFAQFVPDTDGDGWSDGYEFHIGTSPASRCVLYGDYDAWPPDVTKDNYADISDIAAVARWFGTDANGIPFFYRFDIRPEPMGDGIIDISDVIAVGERFGKHC